MTGQVNHLNDDTGKLSQETKQKEARIAFMAEQLQRLQVKQVEGDEQMASLRTSSDNLQTEKAEVSDTSCSLMIQVDCKV